MSDLAEMMRAVAVPSDSFLFLGANPAHTPEREKQDRASCSLCGGEIIDDRGHPRARAGDEDPIRLYETMVSVCACGRATYEGRHRGRASKPNPDVVADRGDQENRTGDAVRGPAEDRPLTRKERRAREFGEKTAKAG